MNARQQSELIDTVRDVVERARAGDQVAMAHIANVRDAAKKGVPRAVMAFKLMKDYIKRHPPQIFGVCDVTHLESLRALWSIPAMQPEQAASAVITEAPKVGFWQAIMAIVHGPKNDVLVQTVYDTLPENEKETFKGGVKSWKSPNPGNANPKSWNLGRIFGIGRAIQKLADESIPISVFCPVTGWELGE